MSKKQPFEEVYERYYDKVYRYIYSLLLNHENTEDVVSDTFITAYAAYDRYDPEKASVATWLTCIAHNKAVDLVRSSACRNQIELSEDIEICSSDDFVNHVEIRETLLWLYSRLTIEEREFLELRYAMELKDAEVAALYELPVKTVNKRYQRLLRRCRDMLKD